MCSSSAARSAQISMLEDAVGVLHVGGERVREAPRSARVAAATSRAAATSSSRRPGAAVALPITMSTAQPSIRASCLLISRGLESPAIFCRNGVWSKTKSRIGRSGAGAWWNTFPSTKAICTCLAVCGLRGSS